MNIEAVRDYYGRVLSSSNDLKTDACCDASAPPLWLRPLLANVHDEVIARYYGCGLVAPTALRGARVLDLGCGSGRDVYVLSQLVGPEGEVVGVDMTEEQLAVARGHQAWHAERFGFDNVRFLDGYIEDIAALGLADGRFDVVVSNCVVNLSPDKPAVLAGALAALRSGGELYFSDVYADRRLSAAIQQDPIALGECLGGALYWNDFQHLAKAAGFGDPRLVEDRPLAVRDAALLERLGAARFWSATWRLFKLAGLEPACEDYGQAVRYRGTLAEQPDAFVLDAHHVIEAGRMYPVCGNTFRMLTETRFAPHFEAFGDMSRHYGIFEGCGTAAPFGQVAPGVPGACC